MLGMEDGVAKRKKEDLLGCCKGSSGSMGRGHRVLSTVLPTWDTGRMEAREMAQGLGLKTRDRGRALGVIGDEARIGEMVGR